MSQAAIWILILGTAGIAFAAIRSAAKRFAARQQRLGKWGPTGPRRPTEPPSGWLNRSTNAFAALAGRYHQQRFVRDERERHARRAAERTATAPDVPTTAPHAIELSLTRTGRLLGALSPDDLAFMTEELEASPGHEATYFIDLATVDALKRAGAREPFIAMLRAAVADNEGEEVTWRAKS